MKKSTVVRLTTLAAIAMAAHAQRRLDPCNVQDFNQQACEVAIQNHGYCWNGRWVNLKYRNPFPYYYDAYQEFVANGGIVTPAVVGSCTAPTLHAIVGAHGAASHGGFGATGSCHGAAAHG